MSTKQSTENKKSASKKTLLTEVSLQISKSFPALKEKLGEVNDGTPIGEGGWGIPNTTPNINPFPNWQHPHYVDPYNPYKITCRGEETPTGTTITTTPGTTGFITIANPNIASFGTGSTGILNTYNPSTSTTYGYPSGSAWSYTTYQPTNIKTEKQTKFKKRKAKSVKEWEDEIDLGGAE